MNATTTPLPDAVARRRFATEVEANFSVVAPAGVGKTHAIAERVLAVARHDLARRAAGQPALGPLVVATYTRKAAQEMRQRVYLFAARDPQAQGLEEQLAGIFFGTIHSLCHRMVAQWGAAHGWTAEAAATDDVAPVWEAFLEEDRLPNPEEVPGVRADLFAHLPLALLLKGVTGKYPRKRMPLAPMPTAVCPEDLDIRELLSWSGRKTALVEADLEALRVWDEARQAGTMLPVPAPRSTGKLSQAWREVFAPLREGLLAEGARWVEAARERFAAYRRERGQLLHEDPVNGARALLEDAQTGPLLRAQGYRVILDEAQDTDEAQFSVLVELARPASAQGTWGEEPRVGPEPGRFAMVGDPQQLIYDHSSLEFYLETHDRLVAGGAVPLTFDVTFRVPRLVCNALNEALPRAFADGPQAPYVELVPRPGAPDGFIARLPVGREAVPEALREQKGRGVETARRPAYAAWLAKWLADQDPRKWGVTDWKQVAVLAPRHDRMSELAAALAEDGRLPYTLYGRRGSGRYAPVYRWFGALVALLADPRDAFEIAGVLREWYGVADDDLAAWLHGPERPRPDRQATLAIDKPPSGDNPFAAALGELHAAWQAAAELPLSEAVVAFADRVDLIGRLAAIPDEGVDNAAAWRRLLVLAVRAEEEGLLPGAWLPQLEEHLAAAPQEPEETAGAVNILTLHKAKGLQWEIVILPWLGASLWSGRGDYPRWLEHEKRLRLVTCDGEIPEASRLEMDAQNRRELERLLYVGLTRTRRGLIVLDDTAFWEGDETDLSLASGLRAGTTNAPWLAALPVATAVGLATPPVHAAAAADAEVSPAVESPPDWAAVARAGERFLRRRLPSGVGHDATPAPHADPRPEAELSGDFPEEAGRRLAAAYGTWWHELMEALPWGEASTAFAPIAERMLPQSPDPERAAEEWRLLASSPWVAGEAFRNAVAHVEMPVLWRASEAVAWEGLIDLALYEPQKGHWQVIDWKTDRTGSDEELLERYGRQIELYQKALCALTGKPVRGFIYRTVTGGVMELPTVE